MRARCIEHFLQLFSVDNELLPFAHPLLRPKRLSHTLGFALARLL